MSSDRNDVGLKPADGGSGGGTRKHSWAGSTVRDQASELTVMSAIKPGLIPGEYRTYEERLRSALASINERANKGQPTLMNVVTPIHFARWFIIRPEQYLQYATGDKAIVLPEADYVELSDEDVRPPENPGRLCSWLILTVNFSGDLAPYIRFLSERVTGELDKVWGHCVGYPVRGARDYENFWLFVRRHQIKTDAFYASYTHLSPPAVHRLRVFKDRFDAFVALTRAADGTSVADIGPLFDAFVQENLAYTKDFPGEGGLYEDDQSDRLADVRKGKKTP